ncbi:MAG: hypothetical protein RMJ44_07565 [Cytophagales bacterium]|nr:hypothetical protein [Bernardetiaceae bacterium]MDW8210932.1 hypothetical protein [Cytophagales bacterium]
MWEKLLKYLAVFGLSMFKFIFGPLTALPLGINYLTTALLTAGGMMASVFIISSLGTRARQRFLQRFAPNRRLFTKRTRQIVRLWRGYGVWGVALLTPLIFTPIGGTIIAVSFGERRNKILLTMLVAATLWAFILSGVVFFASDWLGRMGLSAGLLPS